MKSALITLLVFFFVERTFAQDNKRDSLLSLISTVEDSTKVLLYLDISDLYENSQPSVAIRYCKMAKSLSQRINFTSGEIKSLKWMGSVYLVQSHFDSSMICFKRALKLSSESNDSLNIGITLFNIGSTYRYMAELDSAVHYSLKGFEILESFGSKSTLARMSNGLQLLYYNIGNYTMAIRYGENAVQQARELKDDLLLLESLSNLSLVYRDSYQLVKAKTALLEALKLTNQTNNLNAKATITLNLGGIAQEESNFSLLIEYSKKSLALHQQLGSKSGECTSLRGLAIGYLQDKKYSIAKEFVERALAIADSNNYKLEQAECFKTLSNISYAMQNLVEGEMYFKKCNDLFVEIFKTSYLESAARYEKKYEAEKRDKQIKLQEAQLQKRKILNYVLIGTAAAILIISFLSYGSYIQKQKLQQKRITELETEKQLTATEAVLKGEEQERTRLAKDLHDGLGGMLSGIKYSFNTMKGNLIMTPDNQQAFERSMDMLDSSIQEMRRVAHNMMPEVLVRSGLDVALKDFCNDINQSGAIKLSYLSIGLENVTLDQTTAITLYRIVQELISNTMKHASAKKAIVQVTKTEKQLAVTVEDDGKGFDPSLLNQSRGIGWTNIQNRVDLLKGKLDVQTSPGKGTSVLIEFTV